jgi:hypothetical protein
MLLVVLGVLWVVAVAPPLLRGVRDGRPGDSISSFQRQLRTLQRTAPVTTPLRPMARGGRPAVAPATMRQRQIARQRRRQVFLILAGSAVISASLAIAAGGVFLWVFLGITALLAGWVAVVIQTQRSLSNQYQPIRYHSSRVA